MNEKHMGSFFLESHTDFKLRDKKLEQNNALDLIPT